MGEESQVEYVVLCIFSTDVVMLFLYPLCLILFPPFSTQNRA